MTGPSMTSWLHYNPERVDYSLTESEWDQLRMAAQNTWKDLTIAFGVLCVPCLLNAVSIVTDQQQFHATLPFVLNLTIGVLGLGLAISFGIAWKKTATDVGALMKRIKEKPKVGIMPLVTNVGTVQAPPAPQTTGS